MMRSLLLVFAISCGGGHKAGPPPSNGSATTPPPAGGECVASGCSGSVCAEAGNEIVTTCEMKPEYACYAKATCARQPDGKCGWTQTTELTACLASPPH